MSNVHGFGDVGNNRPQRNNPAPRNNDAGGDRDIDDGNRGIMDRFREPVIEDQLRLAHQHRILFISGRASLKNPRQENYWDMLTFSLCPSFSFISLTFLIVLADIAVFIYLVSAGLNKSSDNLLQVDGNFLRDHGGNYQQYQLLYKEQFYRFLSAIFVHLNFMHIFGNVIVTFMFLSRIQYTFGIAKTLIIYLISGIAGNIFSSLVDPGSVKGGASTSLYGIIGVIIGYIIINWKGFDLLGPVLKCQIWCTGFMIIVFIFIFTPVAIADNNSSQSTANTSIDYFGHLGGFLAGLWLSSIHQTIVNNKREKGIRIAFICLLFIQLLVCFVVFYTTQTPK